MLLSLLILKLHFQYFDHSMQLPEITKFSFTFVSSKLHVYSSLYNMLSDSVNSQKGQLD